MLSSQLPRLVRSSLLCASFALPAAVNAAILWDNGPLITGTAGSNDISEVSPGGTNFGLAVRASTGNRAADDFTVSGGAWSLDSARFFTYQTLSPLASPSTTSTITGVTLRIWSGLPGSGTVVWGDTSTNVLAATGFTGAYRVTSTATTNTQRPIMFADVNLTGLVLADGTYWLDFNFTGSLLSGPWAPPVSDDTSFITGNALLSLAGGPFGAALDEGAGLQVALPFVLSGTAIPEPSSAALLLGLGAMALVAGRRRR